MSNNHPFVFRGIKASGKYSYVAELRSSKESTIGFKPTATLMIKLLSSGGKKGADCIRVQIPNVREDIPIGIMFRALGLTTDKDIIQHICYDLQDVRMLELLRPSIEESFPVQTREIAEIYIANRGVAGVGVAKEDRLAYAKVLLQNHLLPHIGVTNDLEVKKAYYLGYMVHKLLQTALGRRPEDDRDHYANKRLDLAGPLMANLFR
jgi:DNA-directed RNA polymerase II subunit RPB2